MTRQRISSLLTSQGRCPVKQLKCVVVRLRRVTVSLLRASIPSLWPSSLFIAGLSLNKLGTDLSCFPGIFNCDHIVWTKVFLHPGFKLVKRRSTEFRVLMQFTWTVHGCLPCTRRWLLWLLWLEQCGETFLQWKRGRGLCNDMGPFPSCLNLLPVKDGQTDVESLVRRDFRASFSWKATTLEALKKSSSPSSYQTVSICLLDLAV